MEKTLSIKVLKNAGQPDQEVLKEFFITEQDEHGNYLAGRAIQDAVDYAISVGADTIKYSGARMAKDDDKV